MTERLDGKERTMRETHQGEPIADLTPVAIEMYKATLSRLHIDKNNLDRCVSYLIDPVARELRAEQDNTVEVKGVEVKKLASHVDTYTQIGKRVLSNKGECPTSRVGPQAINAAQESLHDRIRIFGDLPSHAKSVIKQATAGTQKYIIYEERKQS